MDEQNFKKARLEKLEKLKELQIDPYPATTKRTHSVAQALDSEGKNVAVTGRIFSYREHGNIAFADLKDESGKIQIFFQKKILGPEGFKNLRLLDIGDFIQVEGEVGKTIAGEISIMPASWQLLTKSLLPLPSEFYGLKDVETRLRKRYLDLLMNPEVKDDFKKKTKFWQSIRNYMVDHGFLEVETPVLQQIPGGADARPFVTHHNAQDMDLYLRISLELPLKRLLVGGFEKVFEIGRIFRNEGIDDEHLQDYTQLEFYWAYADYSELMDFVEDMYKKVIQETFGSLKTQWNGQEINWEGNWPRKDYAELLNEHWQIHIEELSVEDLYKLADEKHVKVEPNLGKGRLLDYLYKKTIRPKLVQPMFVLNHPVEVEPLAKRLPDRPQNVQRMQVLAMGSELGKGFSELNDPIDQRERFEEQMKLREAGDEEAQMMDEDFVEALEYGMPPAAGFGVSERLFALLIDKPVREMVFFPTLKPDKKSPEE
ncbi:MAG: lysine--tRNA ligase [Candidatus Levyibacteriota bacterium]